MQGQDTLRNLTIAGAVFLTIYFVMMKVAPIPAPRPDQTDAQSDASGGAPNAGLQPSPTSGTAPVAASESSRPAPDHTFTVIEAEQTLQPVMGSATNGPTPKDAPSPYRMRLTLSNVGASVETATMTDHAEKVGGDARYTLLAPVQQLDGTIHRSLAIETVNVDGAILNLADKKWNAGPVTENEQGQTAEFWIEIQQDQQPALKLTRRIELPRQPQEQGQHDLHSTLRIENLSPRPRKVLVTYRGGVGVSSTPGARLADRIIDWGVHDGQTDARVEVSRNAYTEVGKDPAKPLKLFAPSQEAPDARLSWAATANTYFTCTVAPLTHEGQDNPDYLTNVSAVDLDQLMETQDDVTVRFVTREQQLAAGETLALRADVFLGEKDGVAYRDVAKYRDRNYYEQISQGFGFCTFSWLVELMIRLLNGLHFIVRDYGVAIIILVLVVRLLLHPITKKGQVNMVKMQHKMQEMAPKIEEIKKKYANDKARLNQEMMKLNINPAGQILTCLPMFIQMPIWVALFLSLSNNIQMRHEPFLFTWVNDLTAPDALYTFGSPIIIPLLGWSLPAFNLLPILMAVFMYTQQKLQPKPAPNPNMTDQQRQQQDMMKMMTPMMSIMMLIFFYKGPSGLNLYIFCSSLFGTIEQHRIRKHIKEREAAGTLHKPKPKNGDAEPKRGGKPSFIEKLQKMADQAQKGQAQQPRRKPRP